MKRIGFIAAFLLIGFLAFGQITGSVESGFKVVSDATGTKIQHFSWNSGAPGFGQIKVNGTAGNTSADFYIRTADFSTLMVPYAWITQKYGNVALRVGKIDNNAFATPYQGLGGIGGQGLQLVYNGKGFALGGFVPLANVLTDISSIADFKAGASIALGGLSVNGSYDNAAESFTTGTAFTTGGVIVGFDTLTDDGVTVLSPSVDVMFGDKLELTLDVWTDTADLVGNSETAFWLNYWFKPEFRLLGRVIYTGAGDIKTREGFVFKPSAKATVRAQVDSTWIGSPAHVLNVMFVHSF